METGKKKHHCWRCSEPVRPHVYEEIDFGEWGGPKIWGFNVYKCRHCGSQTKIIVKVNNKTGKAGDQLTPFEIKMLGYSEQE